MDLTSPVITDEFHHSISIEDLCARLEWSDIFSSVQPVEIDLGAGDGSFIVARARAHPKRNFLAVERLLGRAKKIARKASRSNLANLKVLRFESLYAVERFMQPETVSVIHLMFPDPWPKRRHWPKRLVQPEFVEAVATVLELQGEFRLTTDHEDYFKAANSVLAASSRLIAVPLWDFSADSPTDFQREFEKEGRAVYRACWKKVE